MLLLLLLLRGSSSEGDAEDLEEEALRSRPEIEDATDAGSRACRAAALLGDMDAVSK